jgi:hypothetical protein
MPNLSARRLAACVALLTGLAQAASAAEILIADAKSQPESLTVAPGGVLIVGSASTPFVYKVRRARPLPRSSSMPALKAPAPFSSACLPMPLPTRCGRVS